MPQPYLASPQELRLRNVEFSNRAYDDDQIRPARHVFVLTNRCNLKCKHCFQDRSRDANAMTVDDWLKVIAQLPSHSAVTLTGGEPMLFRGFEDVFEAITEKHLCNIITNGLLLNTERSKILVSRHNFRALGVSIDGTAPYMEKIRGVNDEKFSQLVADLQEYKGLSEQSVSKPILNVKTVILDENTHNLFDCHRFACEELNANTHDFYFLKGSPIQHADYAYQFEAIYDKPAPHFYANLTAIREQLDEIKAYDRLHGSKTFIHPDADVDSIQAMTMGRFETNSYQLCKFPWSSLHINHNGDVFPCLSVKLGNVKQQSLEQVYDSDEYKRFKATIRKSVVPACISCGWLKKTATAEESWSPKLTVGSGQ
jgi:MoaA/NifB/PqqE/SkfB family radical SAM enzyme